MEDASMNPRELWERYQAMLFDEPALGFRLDLSRMGFGEREIEERAGAIGRALAAMAALERGEVANPDEKRMVGHYWLRAPEQAPTPEIAAAIRGTRDGILDFARRVHDGRLAPPGGDRFRELLVIGIGGSALGPTLTTNAVLEDSLRVR
jgi:glucose-6-phosphate isomerase